jgi:hypothetical protein
LARRPTEPNADITVSPWKEPEELKQRTINLERRFLKAVTASLILRQLASYLRQNRVATALRELGRMGVARLAQRRIPYWKTNRRLVAKCDQ